MKVNTKTKSKAKFDIKEFFILHSEKIVLALAIPLALFFASRGLNYEPLEWKPQALVDISNEARRRIDSNDRTAFDVGVVIFRFDNYANSIKSEVKREFYRTTTMWDASIYPERPPRTAPTVLPIHGLKARAGIGAIQVRSTTAPRPGAGFVMGGDGGGMTAATEKEGKRWVVLTGLIPVKEQLNLYLELFPSSKYSDPFRDTPMYAYYDVERCEVTATGASDWRRLNVMENYKKEVVNKWAGTAPELVDQTYIPPVTFFPMVYPLPPIGNKMFGPEITQPSIPMFSETLKEDKEILQKRMEEYNKKQLEFDPTVLDRFNPFGPRAAGGDSSMSGGPPREMAGGMQQVEERPEDFITVTDYLFRFFDFEVEQGKTYRYRVKLYLANPNYMLEAMHLENPSLADDKFLATEFSSESNAITIGTDARVLTTGVTAPSFRQPWNEPTASLMMVAFDMDTGGEWFIEREQVRRGTVADFLKVTTLSNYLKAPPVAEMGMSMDMGMEDPSGRRGRPKPPPKPKASDNRDTKNQDVVSGVCVLDMAGGLTLPGRGTAELRSPGKVLLMEPNGALVIRNISEDMAEVDQYRNPAPQMSSYDMSSSGSMMSP